MTNKLINSPHTISVGCCTFYFNTEKALLKFIEERDDVLKETNTRLMKIYKGVFNIDVEILSDVRLYHKINRRGFLVKYKDITFNSLDEIQFTMNQIIKI